MDDIELEEAIALLDWGWTDHLRALYRWKIQSRKGDARLGGLTRRNRVLKLRRWRLCETKERGPRGFDGSRDDGDDETVKKTSVWIDGTGTGKGRRQSLAPFHTLDKQLYEGAVSIAACRTNPSRRRQSFDHASLVSLQRGSRAEFSYLWPIAAAMEKIRQRTWIIW